MSLTSYRAAPPRVIQATLASSVQVFAYWQNTDRFLPLAKYRLRKSLCDLRICAEQIALQFVSCSCGPKHKRPLCERPFDRLWAVSFVKRRFTRVAFCRPGSDRLSRVLRRSTIGAGAFHGRVRKGNGCSHPAMTTRSAKRNLC